MIESDLTKQEFPGRSFLMVREVSAKLRVSDQHVLRLIESGQMGAINASGNPKSSRRTIRIPAENFRDYLRKRSI